MHRHLSRHNRQPAGLDGSDAEQITDQVIHALAGSLDDLQLTDPRGLRARLLDEERRRHRDRVERIAQIVGNDPENFLASVDDFLRIVIEAIERDAPDFVHHDSTNHVGDAERKHTGQEHCHE